MAEIKLRSADTCTACGACFAVCPRQAITMGEDAFGFRHPVIDEALCVKCGKCMKVCSALDQLPRCVPQKTYAAYGSEEALVKASASGGMFASLAKALMAHGGMAAGAVMDTGGEHLQVRHILSDKASDIFRMQGSKYVQSDAWQCYGAVADAVKTGRTVLFSGTPCQAAAVKALTQDPENLVTMELVCHGVPSVRMLDEFLTIMAKRLGGKIENFTFRDKSCRKNFCGRLDMKKHGRTRSLYLRAGDLSFYKYFLDGAIYRENCYACPYASMERTADLTIGDYWGVEAVHKDAFAAGQMPAGKDWSCLLVNTEKGQRFLETFGGDLQLFASQAALAARNNGQLRQPSKKPAHRQTVLARYLAGGYDAVERGFVRETGGVLRYYRRMIKHSFQNRAARRSGK